MKTSQSGIDAIGIYEGCKLQSYLDGAGVPTIGYGHTKGIKMGMTCTLAQAKAWLAEDLADAENDVSHMVKVRLTQNQFDALVSFAFNLGGGALARSTLLKLLNAKDYSGAAGQFKLWNLVAGKPSLGVTRRRASEATMFSKA